MDTLFCFSLTVFWELVEDVCRLMNPATLATGLRKNFSYCFPETQCPITHSKLGWPKPTILETEQHLGPTLLWFSIAIFNSKKLFISSTGHTNNDQNTLPGIITPDVEISAICPDINIALFREVSCSPIIILINPTLFKATNCSCRETFCILP